MSAAATSPSPVDQLAALLLDRYAGRRTAYGRRTFLSREDKWGYTPARLRKGEPDQPLNADVVKRHLTGRADNDPIGVYLFEAGGSEVRFAVLDVDNHGGELAWDDVVERTRPLVESLSRFGKSFAVRSGGGNGIHLVLFFERPVAASKVRTFLNVVLKSSGLKEGSEGGIGANTVEVFPKQNGIKATEYGNMIALPFARASVPLDDNLEPLPLASSLDRLAAVAFYEVPDMPEEEARRAKTDRAAPSPASPSKIQPPATGEAAPEAENVVPLAKVREGGRFDMAGALAGIAEGGRDTELWSMACALRAVDVPQAAAEALVLAAAEGCKPPFPRAAALEKVRRAYAKHDPNIALNDSGNADYFVKLYGDQLRYNHSRKRWYRWVEHWWQSNIDGEDLRLAQRAMRNLAIDAGKIEDAKKARATFDHAQKSLNERPLKSLVAIATKLKPISDDGLKWDQNPWLFGVANGVLDLTTGQLREGRREDRITMHSPVAFDPEAKCPRWERYLSEVYGGDQEMVNFIHRYAGYSLTGSVEEEMLTLHCGAGGNGKSVLLRVLEELFGEYATVLPFTELEEWSKKRVSNAIAALAGKRLVVVSEADEGAQINAARVKSLVSRDTQTARFLFGEYFKFRPTLKAWIALNDLPKVSDETDGFWRRVAVVQYNQSFKGRASEELRLDDWLIENELPGILAWAVRGCLDWQKRTMQPFPSVVAEATAEYRESEDEIGQWIAARCTLREDLRGKPTALFDSYKEWAERMDIPPWHRLDIKKFGARLQRRFGSVTPKGIKFYKGIDVAPHFC